MKIDDLLNKAKSELCLNIDITKMLSNAIYLKNENLSRKKNFCYPGVYFLFDKKDEVVYIGSSYARNVHDRLLQYTHDPSMDTGNTLANDLIDAGCTDPSNVCAYISSLRVVAFEDKSVEYKLISIAGTAIVNKHGKTK
jgi:hypothetical protein